VGIVCDDWRGHHDWGFGLPGGVTEVVWAYKRQGLVRGH
jgi:hypothetical protein